MVANRLARVLGPGRCAVPALSAIWMVPWFVTQDGPAHVYNAQILAESFDPRSPSHSVYTISWKPIPNWMGHIVLAGLVSRLPAWMADRIMTSATLVGLAAATLWLRWRVAGGKGLVLAAFLSALLAMNSVAAGLHELLARELLVPDHARRLVGGTLPAVRRRIAALSALLCVGYFCHLVSLGLTVVGLVVLAVGRPGAVRKADAMEVPDGAADAHVDQLRSAVRARHFSICKRHGGADRCCRCGKTYRIRGRRRHGGHGWAGSIRSHSRSRRDFRLRTGRPRLRYLRSRCCGWAWRGAVVVRADDRHDRASSIHAATVAESTRTDERRSASERARDDRQAWLVLAALLLVGGIAGPDSFGAAHGEFLPQRVVLLGLIALVPVFDVDLRDGRGGFLLAAIASRSHLQSAIVWDYATLFEPNGGADHPRRRRCSGEARESSPCS